MALHRRWRTGVLVTPMILAACLGMCFAPPVEARPAYKKALADYLGPFLAKKLNDCRTCHLPAKAEVEDDMPHNAFGARLKAVRKERTRAGKQAEGVSVSRRFLEPTEREGGRAVPVLPVVGGASAVDRAGE